MMPDDAAHVPERSQVSAQAVANDRVLLDALELLRGEGARLPQNRVWQRDLADVMKVPAALERRQRVLVQTESHPDVGRPVERIGEVPHCSGV
jgi:hypothetical protein